jgi:hypothetical protein
MSALPPKADITERRRHVRFVPKAGISRGFLKTANRAGRIPAPIRNGIKVELDCGFAFQF